MVEKLLSCEQREREGKKVDEERMDKKRKVGEERVEEKMLWGKMLEQDQQMSVGQQLKVEK